jgi:hypothetical protein
MSYGLVCLNCRRYIGTHGFVCACAEPEPSWDLSTPTNDAQAAEEVSVMLACRRLNRQSEPRTTR